nr:hypothetical protein [uncultured Caproiciproducens sp.]
MDTNNEIIQSFADAFSLPIINDETRVWFFRTQSGLYYYDFYLNNYIALGWDLISKSLITDDQIDSQSKKERISKLYPDEQRPGLIFGQMDTFYTKMQTGDLVVIPSGGGREISIGTLGDICLSVIHGVSDNEYEECTYKHKRKVSWLKRVDLSTDVYLSKVLRAQQTISDISEYAEMVYRNLHPCYISEDSLHLMLQKRTSADFSITDNISLQHSIVQINYILSEYFGIQSECEKIKIKTAVGSPGFLEILLPSIPVSTIAVACIFKTLVGKTKNSNGEMATGIMAIISKGNDLWNDHWNRKKVKAEIEQIEAITKRTHAETAQIEANIRKSDAETLAICSTTKQTKAQIETALVTEDKDQLVVAEVIRNCEVLKTAAEHSGIRIDKKLENVS